MTDRIGHSKFLQLDGSDADVQATFERHVEWSDVCEEGANWLLETIRERFPNENLYALSSAEQWKLKSPRATYLADKKIHELRQIGATSDVVKVDAYFLEIACWPIEENSIPDILLQTLNDRFIVLFLSAKAETIPQIISDAFSKFVEEYDPPQDYNKIRTSDNAYLINFLVDQSAIPIRTWGFFDDRYLSLELYENKQVKVTH